jgi:hypothetical protein
MRGGGGREAESTEGERKEAKENFSVRRKFKKIQNESSAIILRTIDKI